MKNVLLGIALISLFSCSNNTVEQDVQKYCDCIQKNRTNSDGRQQCIEEMNDILIKYEYDPEAMDELSKRLGECH